MQNLYMKGYRGFIHNHQILETTQRSFNRYADQQTVQTSGNGLLFQRKNKRAQESQTHNAEKPDWEGDILYKSLTVTSLKEKKTNRTIETRADQWLPGIGMGEELKLEGVSTGEFFKKWDFLYFDCAIK